jgi:hypothetical protein
MPAGSGWPAGSTHTVSAHKKHGLNQTSKQVNSFSSHYKEAIISQGIWGFFKHTFANYVSLSTNIF